MFVPFNLPKCLFGHLRRFRDPFNLSRDSFEFEIVLAL